MSLRLSNEFFPPFSWKLTKSNKIVNEIIKKCFTNKYHSIVDLITSCLIDIIVVGCSMDLTKKNKFIQKPTTQSKLDKQLEASVFFKETSEWLKDAAKEMTSIHDNLKPELQN